MADEAQKPRAFTLKDGRIAYGTVEFEDGKYMRIRRAHIKVFMRFTTMLTVLHDFHYH